MDPIRRCLLCLFTVLVLCATGCSAATPAVPEPSASSTTELLVAPYLDVTGGTVDVAGIHSATGLTDFTLAFLLAGETGGCTPAWGGTTALTDSRITTVIEQIRAYGGQPIVSTGGASGTYLEQVCDATQLATAYRKALDLAGSNHLDVDIEQEVDVPIVISALAGLQQSRGTVITFTVPVEATGLAAGSVTLLQAARAAGLEVTVNAMVMNFDAAGDWGTAMANATEAVRDDLAAIWTDRGDTRIRAMLGVTTMIGVNDTGAVTTIADARTLVAYAREKGLGFLRFWSVNRDNGNCSTGSLSGTCSGISQDDYAFTSLFADAGAK